MEPGLEEREGETLKELGVSQKGKCHKPSVNFGDTLFYQ